VAETRRKAKPGQVDGLLTRRRAKNPLRLAPQCDNRPNFITSLKNQSRKTMLRDPDCGRQPVGARSHHDGIIFIPLLHVWSFSLECQPKEITQKPSILVGSLLRLLLVPVDRKDQKCTYARSIRQQCLPGSIQAGIKFGRVFGQLINASSRGSWWRWRDNNLGVWTWQNSE
jgi:hypothetical protein